MIRPSIFIGILVWVSTAAHAQIFLGSEVNNGEALVEEVPPSECFWQDSQIADPVPFTVGRPHVQTPYLLETMPSLLSSYPRPNDSTYEYDERISSDCIAHVEFSTTQSRTLGLCQYQTICGLGVSCQQDIDLAYTSNALNTRQEIWQMELTNGYNEADPENDPDEETCTGKHHRYGTQVFTATVTDLSQPERLRLDKTHLPGVGLYIQTGLCQGDEIYIEPGEFFELDCDFRSSTGCQIPYYTLNNIKKIASSDLGTYYFSLGEPHCTRTSFGGQVHGKDDNIQALINWQALNKLRIAERNARHYAMQGPSSAQSMMAGNLYKWADIASKLYTADQIMSVYDRNLFFKGDVSPPVDVMTGYAPYCSPLGAFYGLCAQDTSQISVMNGSISASNFAGVTSYLPQGIQPAREYLDRVFNGSPMPIMPMSQACIDGDCGNGMTPEGMEHWANRLKNQALLSLPQYVGTMMFSERLPQSNLASLVEISGLPDEVSTDLSVLGLLEYESRKRYANADWYVEMNKASVEALMREIANMYALYMVLDFKENQSLERIEGLLAMQVASLAVVMGDAQDGKEAGQEAGTPGSELNTLIEAAQQAQAVSYPD